MKFTAIFFLSLFGLAAMATADAGECRADGKSIESAIVARTGTPATEFAICAISNTSASSKAGYVETTVQYAEGGKYFCMRSPVDVRVTVKGECE